jgi:glycopeptide antibiotics resistance protein
MDNFNLIPLTSYQRYCLRRANRWKRRLVIGLEIAVTLAIGVMFTLALKG